jgi:hypothetical protein
MNDENAKKTILARRARFVAAAMMGVGLASCEGKCAPSACLKIAVSEPDAAPMPCLSPPALLPDAGVSVSGGDAGDDAAADAGPADAGSADAGPADAGPADAGPADAGRPKPPPPPRRRCLSVAHPQPQICLLIDPGDR